MFIDEMMWCLGFATLIGHECRGETALARSWSFWKVADGYLGFRVTFSLLVYMFEHFLDKKFLKKKKTYIQCPNKGIASRGFIFLSLYFRWERWGESRHVVTEIKGAGSGLVVPIAVLLSLPLLLHWTSSDKVTVTPTSGSRLSVPLSWLLGSLGLWWQEPLLSLPPPLVCIVDSPSCVWLFGHEFCPKPSASLPYTLAKGFILSQ